MSSFPSEDNERIYHFDTATLTRERKNADKTTQVPHTEAINLIYVAGLSIALQQRW